MIFKKYTNKYNVTQIVQVISTKGEYSLCKNTLGTYFYAPTKGLKNT